MEALILSCSTGGGHNTAARAIKTELENRGHTAVMMDPYELVSEKLAHEIGSVYIKMVTASPHAFGLVYKLGNLVRHIPINSPVYYANVAVAKKLGEYLSEHKVDIIITTHLYPAELITYLKKNSDNVPPSIFVATDYVCIPFTEETNCDYYVIPGIHQAHDFIHRGIPESKIVPLGIPVAPAFESDMTKEQAREYLGLEPMKKYLLLAGGSMGAGNIDKTIQTVLPYFDKNLIFGQLIIITGNNEKLYNKLQKKYGRKIILIKHTDDMAAYMRACDIFISKPGGLSSTEAAVSQVPCIHMAPIPGCETYNTRYFKKSGMSVPINRQSWSLKLALKKLEKPRNLEKMMECQKNGVPRNARARICRFAEMVVDENNRKSKRTES